MTEHQHSPPASSEPPYDPKRQIKEDEEKMVRDAVQGVFIFLIIIGSLGVGAFFALYAEDSYRAAHPPEILNKATWGKSPDHVFTNPVLFVDGDKGDYPEFESLDNELNGYIAEAKREGAAENIAVYFRDLNSGHWTGINEDDGYAQTGDVRRVMLMLAYDANAGRDPAVLLQELYYQNDQSSDGPASGFYTVQDLIADMIRYSDDSAEKVLAAFHPDYMAESYADFRYGPDVISARQYAAVFHDLYDGTYLPSAVSEQALHLLALTKWNDGIVAGMRLGIATDADTDGDDDEAEDATNTTPVAHAFGEYTETTSEATNVVADREIHDCGIVYFPAKPYLLCVMTRSGGAGNNATGTASETFSTLAGVISTISRLTYNYVEGR